MKNDIYLRVKQVKERTGLSRATIYNMMKSGTFPMKTALGTRAIGWLESEITLWMVSRKDVEKRGLEAKPNPGGNRKRSSSPSAVTTVVEIEVPAPNGIGTLDGWGEDDDLPSKAEVEAVQSRLRSLNARLKTKKRGTHS